MLPSFPRPAPLLLLLLAACGSGDPLPPPPAPTLEGVWQYSGYGALEQIEKTAGDRWRLTRYELAGAQCLRSEAPEESSAAELARSHALAADGQSLERREPGQLLTPGLQGQRLNALPAPCGAARIKGHDEPGHQSDRQRDFDWAWQSFEDLYHDFTLSRSDWRQAQTLRARLRTTSSPDELFQVLSDLLRPLGDGHSALYDGDRFFAHTRKPMLPLQLAEQFQREQGLSEPLSPAQREAQEAYVDEAIAALQGLVFADAADPAEVKLRANQQLAWRRDAQGIVTLLVRGLDAFGPDGKLATELPPLQAALDEFIRDCQGAKGVILDLRFNTGGFDESALRIASRFATGRVHVYSKQARAGSQRTALRTVHLDPQGASTFAGPVAVLTSPSTFSAAEVLALALRALPQVKLIGEPSGGGLSDALPRRTPGGLRFTLSNEFYLSPRGEWFEGRGVPVDIEAPFMSPEHTAGERDPGLERAKAWLLTGR